MTRLARALALLVACLTAPSLGCVSEDAVRDYLAPREVCPPDKLTVKERPDIADHVRAEIPLSIEPPSDPEIARDPARLAYWRQQRSDAMHALWDHAFVFEVQGCGKHGFTMCKRSSKNVLTCAWMK